MVRLLKPSFNALLTQSQPASLVHFVTSSCNARCAHCFIDFDNADRVRKMLSLQEIETLTENLGSSLINVHLTGGEPFLRKDLYAIARAYSKNAQVKSIYINTNGFFSDRINEFIKDVDKILDNSQVTIAISIDDIADRHDTYRKCPGLFAQAMRSYHLISGAKIENLAAVVNLTMTEHNYTFLKDVYESLIEDHGVLSFSLGIQREAGVIKEIVPSIKQAMQKAYQELALKMNVDEVHGRLKSYGKSPWGRLFRAKNKISRETIARNYAEPRFESLCPAAAIFFVIDSNGDVFPCEILENKKMGNLRDYRMNLLKLIVNNESKTIRNFIKDSNCHCTYECALSLNIIVNKKYWLRLAKNMASLR